MNKSDRPINIIGVLFSLSIAFWGFHMVNYFREEMPWPRQGYLITGQVLTTLRDEWKKKENIKLDKEAEAYLEKIKGLRGKPFLTSGEFEKKLKSAEEKAKEEQVADEDPWKDARKAVMEKAAGTVWIWQNKEKRKPAGPVDVVLSFSLILAGLAFLIDIACVMWWYARYIYVIHPTPTLATHFLDFGICGAFNLAANAWTDPRVFLTATVMGAGLLLQRFRLLYGSPEASGTDKYILSSARNWMRNAVVLSVMCLLAGMWLVLSFGVEREGLTRAIFVGLLVLFSLIGIRLTIKFASRIKKSAEMHENRHRRFRPMPLHWPKELEDDGDARQRIMDRARSGLDKFRNMFSTNGVQHDRLISRVHAEADLRVQSYILAIPSWKRGENRTTNRNPSKKKNRGPTTGEVKDIEVERKAFIVGLSHWLDDLLDGRDEVRVYGEVKGWTDTVSSFDLRDNRCMFEKLYRSTVIDHTDPGFYDRLVERLESSVGLDENLPYLYFGLNRVAVGSALFSPRLPYGDRKKLLRSNSGMLGRLVAPQGSGTKRKWLEDLTELLREMQAREDGLGHYLLGFTTKTAQEMAMASEGQPVSFVLSLLYSLLYAPMLYFHDIDEEVESGEMAALETFDVNYEAIVPWIERMHKLVENAPADDRRDSRLLQLKMAFRCFEMHLPQVEREELVKIYLGKEEAARRQ
ncbi:MAG: hypothetical protein ACE5I9_02020 [Candidatus Methylomirabilales bacterium]